MSKIAARNNIGCFDRGCNGNLIGCLLHLNHPFKLSPNGKSSNIREAAGAVTSRLVEATTAIWCRFLCRFSAPLPTCNFRSSRNPLSDPRGIWRYADREG
ncbi:hypothetical protein TNCV_3334791 [Trichonephila clavipes]|nr:hypothetical protein TNCV_3334791 [Trichonephila clavipes]